jgi:hypothetical protein
MVVADHNCRIIAFESGWPGSKNDAYIWRNSNIRERRRELFADGEYLIADKGQCRKAKGR